MTEPEQNVKDKLDIEDKTEFLIVENWMKKLL